MPVGIELGRPLWLLAIPLIAVILIVARLPWWSRGERLEMRGKRRTGRPRTPLNSHLSLLPSREARRFAVRMAWTLLLVVALADAVVTRPLHQQAIVFAVDSSASMVPVRDQAETAVRSAIAERTGDDLAGVVAIGGSSQVEESPTRAPLF